MSKKQKSAEQANLDFVHTQLEHEAKELEKLQKKQARCKHKFIDTKHCLKCGFTP